MVEYQKWPASTSVTELKALRQAGWEVVVWSDGFVLSRKKER